MVAPFASTQRIVCKIVRTSEGYADSGASSSNRVAYKPSTLVPWADPYIAGLVRRLQSEVRFERAAAPVNRVAVAAGAFADLEPPSPSVDADWDAWDQPRWNVEVEPGK